MSNFKPVQLAVQKQFNAMAKNKLFQVEIPERDTLVNLYLNSFEDPVERQHHNCNCCKSFIRQYGNIVTIKDGVISSIWDVTVEDSVFQKVVDNLANYVKQQPISNLFLNSFKQLGTDHNITKELVRWDHFAVTLPKEFIVSNPNTKIGEHKATIQVFGRSLKEITIEACETVLELIAAQTTLYRGAEYKKAVEDFLVHKKIFETLSDYQKEIYIWEHVKESLRIRNTAIGVILKDLSEGMDLTKAVNKFNNSITAPSSFMRSSAPVNKGMIEKAEQTIKELGLLNSLNRRYARESDIPVDKVLFVDRSFKEKTIFDTLKEQAVIPLKQLQKLEEISLDTFITDILPTAKEVELYVENKHGSNFMALTAAKDKEAPLMFNWSNDLAWAYTGNVTDSMKERVKIAGGRLEGALCCRLAWDYTDDLDFHMLEPGGYHIYYPNLRRMSPCGGILDTDANGRDGMRDLPIENIVYENTSKMKEGIYTLQVHNFDRRSQGKGFSIEIEFEGKIYTLDYPNILNTNQTITVAKIKYSKTEGFSIVESSASSASSVKSNTVWNVNTNTFTKVRLVTKSPNFLEEEKGNKHIFFILEGAKSPEPVQGFFNEYLKPELREHRKVFEILGSNTKVDQSDAQLAGLGFSISQFNDFIVKVTGQFQRTLKVKI